MIALAYKKQILARRDKSWLWMIRTGKSRGLMFWYIELLPRRVRHGTECFLAYYVYAHFTNPGFLSFDTVTLWIEKRFCCEHCSVHCRRFSSIPDRSLPTRCQERSPSPIAHMSRCGRGLLGVGESRESSQPGSRATVLTQSLTANEMWVMGF